MLKISDIGKIIRENLRSLESECEMLEGILPGPHRTLWVNGVRRRIAAAEKLIFDTEEKCIEDIVLSGNAQMTQINGLVEWVRIVACNYPDNQCIQDQVTFAEAKRRDLVQKLAMNAAFLEYAAFEEFRKLRIEIKYLAVKTKSL